MVSMTGDDFYKSIGYDPETKRPLEEGRSDRAAEPKPAKVQPAGQKRGGEPKFIEVTIHKFKSNIAHYMRECEEGRIKGVVLKRYDRRVGFYTRWDQKL